MNPIAKIAKDLATNITTHSPAILTGLGAAGVITTSVLAIKATFKAAEWLRREEEVRDHEGVKEELTLKEQVSLVWPAYIPTVAMGTITIAAIVTSHHISVRRQAAIVSLYSLTSEAFTEYKSKVVEKIGDTKELAIRDEIAKDTVEKNPVGDKTIFIANGADLLCYDEYSGRYFESDFETIRSSENTLNAEIIRQNYASLNDWYRLLGLAPLPTGELVGWNTDKLMDIRYTTTMGENNKPALSIGFQAEPIAKFYSPWT